MIVGTKKDILTYKGLSENLDKGIDFLLTLTENTENGRYEVAEGVYCIVSEGEANAADVIEYEVHRKYIDLQYILKGEDTCYYAPLHKCDKLIPYDEEKDAEFVSGDCETYITFKPEDFYILHPFDAHAPCRGENVYFKKAVIKVKI
ncbi:MAG: DUF386 domain-containing protein [Ruminococcaceae bacterium]|nr:DUF386 domain-containing protein [Oscillospiraceae bacterium]